jgi:hypothetical protein
VAADLVADDFRNLVGFNRHGLTDPRQKPEVRSQKSEEKPVQLHARLLASDNCQLALLASGYRPPATSFSLII